MEAEEWEAEVDCVVCGATIHPGTDAGFPIDASAFLCNTCAVARGGVYDPTEDRWLSAPTWDWPEWSTGA